MPLPDLGAFPGWVGYVAYGTLAVCIGVSIFLSRFGFLRGKRTSPQDNPASAEVAAVAMDSRALEQLAGEAAGLAVAVTELAVVGKQLVEVSRAQTKASDKLLIEAGRLRGELQEHGKQIRDHGNEIAKR